MLELGEQRERYHRELGAQATAAGVELLITVGDLTQRSAEAFTGEHRHAGDAAAAASLLSDLMHSGDTILIKGSRGIGLELVASELAAGGSVR
jgi:UDP-N-acetylmuramoyl-tripeptide--D-alanyl-D-alanine ligase